MAIELKDRSFGDSLGTAFSLMFNNILFILKYTTICFVIVLAITAAIGIPLYFYGGIDQVFTQGYWESFGDYSSIDPDPVLMMQQMAYLYLVFFIFYIPFSLVMMVFLPIILTDKFQRVYTGVQEKLSFPDTFKKALKLFLPYLGAGFLIYMGYIGGALLFIIPGLILLTAWSVTGNVLIAEKTGVIDSMKRSWQLTKGDRWEVFGLLFVMYLIFYGIMIVAMIIVMIPSMIIMANMTIGIFVMYGLMFLMMMYIAPLFYSLLTVIYYNLRIRKEGFGIEHLSRDFNRELTEEI